MLFHLAAFLPLVLAAPACRSHPSHNATSSTPQATLNHHHGSSVTITGVYSGGVDVYYGIPYAQPPIGDLRFAHPKPVVYNETFSATTPAPACLQDIAGGLAGKYGISEDCLKLDVYTPPGAAGSKDKLPVVVWIYGGSFVGGASTTYNGTAMMTYGNKTGMPFIYVAMNYRLGIFGWGYGKEIAENGAANLRFRDQRLALEWVRDNIGDFGGDPSRVTLFGQSAGAISVSLHLLDPHQDLFQGAIMESGAQSTAPMGPTASTWQTPYDQLTVLAGCAAPNTTAAGNQSTFDCLKALSADDLVNATTTLRDETEYELPFIWGPSIDGDLIPASPYELVQNGSFARIPFITGNNKDEGTTFVPTGINSTLEVTKYLDSFFPTELNLTTLAEVFSVYPDVPALGSPYGTGNDTFGYAPEFKQTSSIFGDSTFQSRRRTFLRSANSHGFNKTWTYQFEGETPSDAAYMGVTHGTEIYYVFGFAAPALNYTVTDYLLSETMMTYWINFAYCRDPNGDGSSGTKPTTYWAPHDYPANKNLIQLIETNVTMIQDDYRETQMSFWDTIAVSLGF